MKRILIIGATSAIAMDVARIFANRGESLALIARDEEKIITLCKDLRVRGARGLHYFCLDINDTQKHAEAIGSCCAAYGGFDIVFVAVGFLGDQSKAITDFIEAKKIIDTNYTAVVSMISEVLPILEKQNSGVIAVISSVAGDRGRASNFIYGSAKAALNTFLQGLRQSLFKKNISVITIKPGFVDTPMTTHIEKNFLFAAPEKVARDICLAIEKKRDIIYTPFFWRLILFAVKAIPEFIFKRMGK